jgi:hypothetical protein
MWWKKKEQKKKEPVEVKKEEDLLKELCGDNTQLYDVLSKHLVVNPLTSVSEKDIDILIEEAETIVDFARAMDKVIFESTQNPEERERYTKSIQNLASKTIHGINQEKEKAEKDGLTDRANSLEKMIEDYKFISERTEDIISVASELYYEKLLELGQDERRATRALERQRIYGEEWSLREQEKANREARKKEIKMMGKEERRAAEEQEKIEEQTAEERKVARSREKEEADAEERRIINQEETERQARRDERQRNK